MDLSVVTRLGEVGIDKTFAEDIPAIEIDVADGRIRPVGADVLVAGAKARVTLKNISALFSGTRTPPSFRSGPPAEYTIFFALIELTVIEYCRRAGRAEYDGEMERLYTHLRRRPDGQDANPLFSYLQAAVRLYMSVFDVSQAELDAVCRRLSQSASHFATGPTSTNYCDVVGSSLDPAAHED